MSAYVHDSGYTQRRAVVFLGIVGIHVLLIYAFSSGLAMKAVELIAPPIDTTIIEEEVQQDEPPPPPPPEFERPPVQIVAPEISISVPADAPPPPIQNITTRPVPPPPPPPPRTSLARVSGPTTEDYYPSISRNAGEEGRPMIRVCIGADGKLQSAEVGESSGFPRLDEAAVKLAKASRFKAATEAGKPIAACNNLPIRFQLKKSP